MPEVSVSFDEFVALKQEIKLSEKLIETELDAHITDAIERYTGKYVPPFATDWTLVLNEIYPVIQYNLPSIFFRNPRVFLKPRQKNFIAKRRNPLTGQMEEVQLSSEKSAKTQEGILNYKIDHIRYKQEVRKTLFDALLFQHAILWHGYKGDFGMTDERSYFIEDEDVFVMRISPRHFLFDPSTSIENLDQGRWVGRSFWIRFTDVLEDDSFDVDKQKLKGTLGYGEKVTFPENATNPGGQDVIQLGATAKSLIDYADTKFKDMPQARFIKLYEIFKRPSPKEKRKGEKGKIILLCFEQDKPLRKNHWDYKAKGFPSKILQFNPVPDKRFGLADHEVYGSIADHKNLVVNQQIRNAENLNRVIIGVAKEGMSEEQINEIRNGSNNVIPFETEDVRTRLFVAQLGTGASQELYQLDSRIDKNLQDKSGVTDLKRGYVQSGEESATSIRERAAGSSARPAYRQDLMADFLKESCLYLNELIKQYVPVEEAVRIIGSLDVEWTDAPTKEEIQADVDVELDVQSMLPESPEKEVQELTTILDLMVQALGNPTIYQKIQEEGKMFNLSPIIENLLMRLKIRNPDVFRQIAPDESSGYVKAAELQAAQANVQASLTNQPPPSPPAPGQDHSTRLEIYTSIQQLLQELGHTSDQLNQLIRVQTALMQAESEKQNPEATSVVKSAEQKMEVY